MLTREQIAEKVGEELNLWSWPVTLATAKALNLSDEWASSISTHIILEEFFTEFVLNMVEHPEKDGDFFEHGWSPRSEPVGG